MRSSTRPSDRHQPITRNRFPRRHSSLPSVTRATTPTSVAYTGRDSAPTNTAGAGVPKQTRGSRARLLLPSSPYACSWSSRRKRCSWVRRRRHGASFVWGTVRRRRATRIRSARTRGLPPSMHSTAPASCGRRNLTRDMPSSTRPSMLGKSGRTGSSRSCSCRVAYVSRVF